VVVTAMVVLSWRMTVDRGLVMTVCVLLVQQGVAEHGRSEPQCKSLPTAPLPAAGCCRGGDGANQKNRDEKTGNDVFPVHGAPPFQRNLYLQSTWRPLASVLMD